MNLSVAPTGELHATAGPSGPPRGSDEECPEEEGHRLSLCETGAWGLHPTGQRELGVYLWEPPHVPVQSESLSGNTAAPFQILLKLYSFSHLITSFMATWSRVAIKTLTLWIICLYQLLHIKTLQFCHIVLWGESCMRQLNAEKVKVTTNVGFAGIRHYHCCFQARLVLPCLQGWDCYRKISFSKRLSSRSDWRIMVVNLTTMILSTEKHLHNTMLRSHDGVFSIFVIPNSDYYEQQAKFWSDQTINSSRQTWVQILCKCSPTFNCFNHKAAAFKQLGNVMSCGWLLMGSIINGLLMWTQFLRI